MNKPSGSCLVVRHFTGLHIKTQEEVGVAHQLLHTGLNLEMKEGPVAFKFKSLDEQQKSHMQCSAEMKNSLRLQPKKNSTWWSETGRMRLQSCGRAAFQSKRGKDNRKIWLSCQMKSKDSGACPCFHGMPCLNTWTCWCHYLPRKSWNEWLKQPTVFSWFHARTSCVAISSRPFLTAWKSLGRWSGGQRRQCANKQLGKLARPQSGPYHE